MKKIIIVGATSGIGRGLAEQYAREDYLIGITGRRENLLKRFAHKIKINYSIRYVTSLTQKRPFHRWKRLYKKWEAWIY